MSTDNQPEKILAPYLKADSKSLHCLLRVKFLNRLYNAVVDTET